MSRGRPAGSACRIGEHHAGRGEHPRPMGLDAGRATGPGLALRVSNHGGEPIVRAAGGSIAGAGHRGEYGDLQLHGRDYAARAAGPDTASLVVLNWHTKPANGRDKVMHNMSGTTYDDPGGGTVAGIFPYPAFELLRQNNTVFSALFAHYLSWEWRNLNLTIKGQASIASGEAVSGEFFGGLEVRPAAGRLILPGDDRPGGPAIAVVSYAFSQSRFGGPSQAAGQPILIDNLPFTIVGVTPPEFFGVDPAVAPDVFLPMHANELLGASNQFGFRRRLPGTELLLGAHHGPPAAGSEPRAGAGRVGAVVSRMGGRYGSHR